MGNTIYLNGLNGDANNTLCCPIPLEGFNDMIAAANNVVAQANKGLPISPAKAVLNNVITKTNEKITGVTKVLPMVVPAVIKPAANAQIIKDVANTAVKIVTPNTIKPVNNTAFDTMKNIIGGNISTNNTAKSIISDAINTVGKSVVIPAVKSADCGGNNCTLPIREVPQPKIELSNQTGGNPNKKTLRPYNVAEKNAMTRLVIEPVRKMLEENLKVANTSPASLVAMYDVPVYKSFLTETLANWDNPTALKDVFAKYKGKVTNTQALQARAMKANLHGLGDSYVDIMHRFPVLNFNNMNSYGVATLGSLDGWDWSDPVGSISGAVSSAANYVGDVAGNAWDAAKGAVNKSADFLGDVGRAVGDGLKNAATWVVGMLQKYNPVMIVARSAFRGLLAINFRGWASDMQGMRDRGEENKIKDAWTGTFVGGNWGDLVASINEGAGRPKKTTEEGFKAAVETVDAPPPYPTPLDIRILKQMSQPAIDAAVRKYNNDIAEYNKNYNPQPNLLPLPTDIKAIVTSGNLLEIRGQENGNATGLFTDYASIGDLFSPNDYVQIIVKTGDTRYNGTYRVKYLGDDAKGNTWSTLTIDLPTFKNAQGKTAQATGTITKVAKPVPFTAPQMSSNVLNKNVSQFAIPKSVSGLGEAATTAAGVTAASPIIGFMTSIMTSVGVSAGTAATVATGIATGAQVVGGALALKKGYDEISKDPTNPDAYKKVYNDNQTDPNKKIDYPDNIKALVAQGKGYIDTAGNYIEKGKAAIETGKQIVAPYLPSTPNNGGNNANNGAETPKILSGNILEMRGQEAGAATGLFTDYAGVGSILQAGDSVQIAVKTGDMRYNGIFKVKYIGDDAGQNSWNTITIDLPRLIDANGKTAQATGVFTAISNGNQGGNQGGKGGNTVIYAGIAAALALGFFLYARSNNSNTAKAPLGSLNTKTTKPKTIKNYTI